MEIVNNWILLISWYCWYSNIVIDAGSIWGYGQDVHEICIT